MTFRQYFRPIFQPFILIPALLLFLLLPACGHGVLRHPGKEKKAADALNMLISKEYTLNKDGSYDLHLHVIRKILTYKGKKDFADFKFTYNNSYQSVTVNKAQTTTPNGSVVSASQKEYHDIQAPWTARASIYSHSRQKVINLPTVSVGACIEIELTLHSQLGFWTSEIFRLANPIHKKIVSITVPRGMELTIFRPPWMEPARVQELPKNKIYRWLANDVPAVTHEQLMPMDDNMGSCLLISTFTSWQQVATWYRNRLLLPDNSKKPLPAKILKQLGLDLSSVDKIYESLMQQTTPHPISFLETGLKPQLPLATIVKGHGTPADLALAFYQLLKQHHNPARVLFVNTRGVVLTKFSHSPSPGLFTNPVVRCRNRDYSFQQQELPPGFTGCEGQLAIDLADGRIKPIITTFSNHRSSIISLRINGQGIIEGSLHTALTGQPAIAIRKQLSYLTPEERLVATSQILHTIDPLASLRGPFITTGIDNPEQPVTIDFSFTIPRELSFAGGYYFLNLPIPSLPDDYSTCRENRRNPLLIKNDFSEDVELSIQLPKDFIFTQLPADINGQLTNLTWKSASRVENGSTLTWSRKIHLNQGIIQADENYQQFRKAIIRLYEPKSRMVMIKPLS